MSQLTASFSADGKHLLAEEQKNFVGFFCRMGGGKLGEKRFLEIFPFRNSTRESFYSTCTLKKIEEMSLNLKQTEYGRCIKPGFGTVDVTGKI